jgi:serine/threonine protein kinase
MSPEQAAGAPVDHRSDLFSLGAVLYFMAAGHPPFRGTSALGVLHRISREPHTPVWQVNAAIPDELSDVVDRLLEKKPSRRFASAEDVQQALAALLSRAQGDGFGRRRFRGWRGRRLRKKAAWIAAASLCCVAIGLAWYVARPSPVAKSSPQAAETQLTRAETLALLASEREQLEEQSQRVVQQPDSEFFQELQAAQQEAAGAPGSTHYLRRGDDVWNHEIDQARRALSELESIGGNLTQ